MSELPQQPDFDPDRPPPQEPQWQPGGHTPQQPDYGPPPTYGVPPGHEAMPGHSGPPVHGAPPGHGIPPGYGVQPPTRRKPGPGMVFGILIGSMALIIVVGLAIGKASGGDGPSASDSPEEVVEQFMELVGENLEPRDHLSDPEYLVEIWSPYYCSHLRDEMSADLEENDYDDLLGQYSEEELALMEDMEVDFHYEITGSSMDGDFAVVDVHISIGVTMDGEDSEWEDSSGGIELVREDGKWLICGFVDDDYTL